MLSFFEWKIEYFNYWLTHLFYFIAGLIIITGITSNWYEKHKRQIAFLNRLNTMEDEWLLNQ